MILQQKLGLFQRLNLVEPLKHLNLPDIVLHYDHQTNKNQGFKAAER